MAIIFVDFIYERVPHMIYKHSGLPTPQTLNTNVALFFFRWSHVEYEKNLRIL